MGTKVYNNVCCFLIWFYTHYFCSVIVLELCVRLLLKPKWFYPKILISYRKAASFFCLYENITFCEAGEITRKKLVFPPALGKGAIMFQFALQWLHLDTSPHSYSLVVQLRLKKTFNL